MALEVHIQLRAPSKLDPSVNTCTLWPDDPDGDSPAVCSKSPDALKEVFMKFNFRSALALPCLAAVLAVTGFAHAGLISGSVYNTPGSLSSVQNPPTGPAIATFSVDSINFFSPGGATYTVGGFLTPGGVTGLTPTQAALDLNNKELMFTGFVSLTAGQTITVTHDDGAILYLNGNIVIDSPGPTAPLASMYTVGATGVYSFDLLYAEVNGSPATLNFPANFPEPSTFMLMGTGLLGAAGAIRRRMRA